MGETDYGTPYRIKEIIMKSIKLTFTSEELTELLNKAMNQANLAAYFDGYVNGYDQPRFNQKEYIEKLIKGE